MFFKTSALKAYYVGVPCRTGYVLVKTDHHFIDSGFSLPKINDYFFCLSQSVKAENYCVTASGDTFVIYYHVFLQPMRQLQLEMIVFRMGVKNRLLVNLRPTDLPLVKRAIER